MSPVVFLPGRRVWPEIDIYGTVRIQNLDTKLFASHLHWPDRHWSFVMVPDANRGFEFVTDDAVQIDKRAAAWFLYTFYPKELSEHAGTVYLAPIADNAGRPLQAGKTYKLRVPKDVPAKEFWSVTVYDRANWAFINNPLGRAGLDSFKKDTMTVNADGSIDLYFGPSAPAGLESNWIPTMGKSPICGSVYTIRSKPSGANPSRCPTWNS